MIKRSIKPMIWPILPLAALLLFWLGCNSSTVSPGDDLDYRVEGSLVIDPFLESSIISNSVRMAVRFQLGSENLPAGQVILDGRALSLECCQYCLDSVFILANDSTYAHANSSLPLALQEGGLFADTVNISIPDSFAITNVVPANRQILGNDQASLEWSGSTGAEVYVMAAVLADSAYTGYGYSLYSIGSSSGTIPPDAFALTDGINPDTGLYNVYVYSITGSPDSAIAAKILPVPLPDQLDDNVSGAKLGGRFGSVVVSLFDTVRVVQQP